MAQSFDSLAGATMMIFQQMDGSGIEPFTLQAASLQDHGKNLKEHDYRGVKDHARARYRVAPGCHQNSFSARIS